MGMQKFKSLVAAVSSALMVGLFVTIGTQPGDRVAVPMAPVVQPPAPYSLATAQPELPMTSGAPILLSSDAQVPLLPVARIATSVTEESSALEEAPGEDTTVLTVPSSVPTAAIPSVKPGTGTLLSMPVQGRKTSRFGMRFHPIRHVWKLHSGLDLAAPCGTPVGAAAPGTVTRTGWAGGNGIQVKIDHGLIGGHRVVTTYNHLSAIGVNVGQTVTAHQGVGRVGSTGYSTGCHLHFEVIADGNFTNPEPWLSGSTVVVDTTGMGYKQPAPVSAAPLPTKPIVSPSPSASPVPSPSTSVPVSPTPSPSTAPSVSPSPSVVPTPSVSPSPCVSPSPVPSPATGSPDPCVSPSPSPSPSASPASPVPSASPTPSPTPSAGPVDSPSPSPSASPSPSPSPTPTPAPSPSKADPVTEPSPSVKDSPTPTKPQSPPPSPKSSATATGAATQSPTPAASSKAPPESPGESTPEA